MPRYTIRRLTALLTLIAAVLVPLIARPATAAPTATGWTPFSAKINFQPAGTPTVAGYLVDSGAVYGNRGNGYTYGWSADNSASMRDRNAPNSPDQRYDTLALTQRNGVNVDWSLVVPNGFYRVRMVAGDPSFIDSVYKFDVDHYRLIDGTPTSTNRWFDTTSVIQIRDGALSLNNGSGATNNKIAFIEVTRLFSAQVNFQPASSSPINTENFVSDVGYVYGNRGNGYTYGWNADNTANMRDRQLPDVEPLFERLARTQNGGNFSWEVAVPNGTYDVVIVVNDPAFTDSYFKFAVEGTIVVDSRPDVTGFASGNRTVVVTDGRLTLTNASGAINNKINYIVAVQVGQ